MHSTKPETEPARHTRALRLLRAGLFAMGVASLANLGVMYFALAVMSFPDEFIGGTFGPLALGPVIVNSSVAAILATIVYGFIIRYSRRPDFHFIWVAGIALILSFAMFFSPEISHAPIRLFVVLGVMHVVAAVAIVGVLLKTGAGSNE